WLIRELTRTIQRALSSPRTPVSLTIGEQLAVYSVNRRLRKKVVVSRRPRFNDVVNAPNPRGPTDEKVTTLVLVGEDGYPVALLWNYACHPVGGLVRNAVDGHFPTAVREQVRAEFDQPTLPILFFQGFSGDVRPNASMKV